MNLPIQHVVVVKVIGMTWCCGQVAQNPTLKSYPRVRLKFSLVNAEKFKPQRLWIPCSLSIKSERKIHLHWSHADMLRPFSSFGARASLGCEPSNSRMPINILYNGLMGGAYSFYFGSTTRLFSQIPRIATRHNVVWTNGKAIGKNYSSKPSNNQPKSPRACVAHKNQTSVLELASKNSESKGDGPKDIKLPSLNGAKANENSIDVKSTQSHKGKDNVKQKSRSKEKQKQSTSDSAPNAVEVPENPATKETNNDKSKQSHVSKMNSTSSTQMSEHKLANTSFEGKAASSNDAILPSLNTAKANENSVDVKGTQTPKGKGNMRKRFWKKKKQKQLAGESAPEAADKSTNPATKFQEKEIENNQSKQSHTSKITSSTQKEATHIIMKGESVSGKMGKTESDSSMKTNEKLTAQYSSKASAGKGKNLPRTKKTKPQIRKTWPQLYPPITKSVVVVESVTKAKIIQRYLGEMFEVLPSYGHVRDLAARSGSVRPDDDFSMVWEVPSPAWSHLKSIKVALSGAENLILASDPDREGETISWHIIEMLKQQDALREGVTVARVTFSEITESSIKNALLSPREINENMVHAYLARRALDYLIGFNVSPLLWQKLPGCQSAGRIQSAALALICNREKEIDEFKAQEYWTLNAHFQLKDSNSANNISLPSYLTHFGSKRMRQLSISSNSRARSIEEKIKLSEFEVISTKASKIEKKPSTPYITSSLQQDAANILKFSGSHTMKIAEKLYEGVQLLDDQVTGLITYMRTDGFHLSDEAAKDVQSFAGERYGLNFVSKNPQKYHKKVTNVWEVYEAIRPTDIRRLPSMVAGLLDEDSLKLYTLIWARTMACLMEPAVIEQIQSDIGNSNQSIMFHSTSSRVEFPGFQVVYEDAETARVRHDEDDVSDCKEVFEILSNLEQGKPLFLVNVESEQQHTQPPARYSEGSLVKKLEELGMGRPSTYASTIKVLEDRNFITKKNSKLLPEFRGRMVSAFLSNYFSEVTDYTFTADMEAKIDNVSAGITEWKSLLKDYWTRFSKNCESASKVHINQVEKIMEKTFGNALFSSLPDGNRTCPSCQEGTLVFKVNRIGAMYYIACDQHPRCKYIAKTLYGEDEDEDDPEEKKIRIEDIRLLGLHPGTNQKVLVRTGPYGHYVQLGEDRKGHKPKRVSIPQNEDAESITLENALELLKYPVILGKHPDDNHPVILRIRRIGLGIKHRRSLARVPKNMKREDVTLEKALKLLKGKNVKKIGRPSR